MNSVHSQHANSPPPFWGSRLSLGLVGFAAIAAYFLLSEHRAHFVGALPILLLLSCPLMHLFMHHGHGGHGGEAGSTNGSGPDAPATSKPSEAKERP